MDPMALISNVKDPAVAVLLVYVVTQLRALAKEMASLLKRQDRHADILARHSTDLSALKATQEVKR